MTMRFVPSTRRASVHFAPFSWFRCKPDVRSRAAAPQGEVVGRVSLPMPDASPCDLSQLSGSATDILRASQGRPQIPAATDPDSSFEVR